MVVFPHTSLQLELAACVFERNVLLKSTKLKLPWQTGVVLTPFDGWAYRILCHSQYPGINQDPLNCVEVVFFRWFHVGNDNNLHGGAYNKMSQLKEVSSFQMVLNVCTTAFNGCPIRVVYQRAGFAT